MTEALVKVERVGKTFSRQAGHRKWRDLATGMWKRPAREKLWALRDVSFEVMPREMLGIVGANGAGKSTMLRLLGGVGIPTSGRLEVHGRIGALLELGGGFQEDLTGRENAIMVAVVAGLLRSEAVARLDEIIAFSELENFIDAPVRTFSTGMKMRLAFSVAVHTDPDVMLVDEFLSVGDLAFQAKCSARIAALREGGCAIVLVSHSMDQVKDLCDRALWLRKGEIVAFDAAKTVAQAYEKEMREETLRRTAPVPTRITEDGTELRAGTNRIGSFEAEVVNVVLSPGTRISAGDPLEVEIYYHSPSRVENPLFSVSITRTDETLCLDINTESARVAVPEIHGSGSIRLTIDRLDLSAGAYFVNVGIFESSWQYAYDYHSEVYNLLVEGGGAHKGVLAPPCRWSTGENSQTYPGPEKRNCP